jgi:hypothetical protein
MTAAQRLQTPKKKVLSPRFSITIDAGMAAGSGVTSPQWVAAHVLCSLFMQREPEF